MIQVNHNNPTATERAKPLPWLKKLGILGFMFFLIKGLLWLAALAAVTYFGVEF